MADQVVKTSQSSSDNLKRESATLQHISGSMTSSDTEKQDLDYSSHSDHVYTNERVAQHWRGIHGKANYEGRHGFDILLTLFVQGGNVAATNIYRDDDKPLYRRGNKILLEICCLNIVLFYVAKSCYIWRNQSRNLAWNAMSTKERVTYVAPTKDEGSMRLIFRFAH